MSTPVLTNEKKYNLSSVAASKDYAWKQSKRMAKQVLAGSGDISLAHSEAIEVWKTVCPALTEECQANMAWQAVLSVRT